PACRSGFHAVAEAVRKGGVEDVVECGIARTARIAEQRVDKSAGQLAEHRIAGVGGDNRIDDGGKNVAETTEEAHEVTPVLRDGTGGNVLRGTLVRVMDSVQLPKRLQAGACP